MSRGIVLLLIVVLLLGTIFVFFKKFTESQDTTSSVAGTVQKVVPEHWGTVSSELGFSLRYPSQEVGAVLTGEKLFGVSFFFSPEIVTSDKETLGNLYSDIHNMGIYQGLGITAIDPATDVTDFPLWIKEFLKKEDTRYGNHETVLSEQNVSVVFSGYEGYSVMRLVEGSKGQKSPYYARKEIFIKKDEYVYRISHLTPSDDTVFPRSGVAGKEYLKRVNILSGEILETMVFDGSSKTSIVVPRARAPQLVGEAKLRRERLLAALRKGPFFDKNNMYSKLSQSDWCSSQKETSDPSEPLEFSSGIYVAVSDAVSDEDNTAEIHAYDENGGHTGLVAMFPGTDYVVTEERAGGIDWIELGSSGYGLSIEENINGKVEIIGKNFSLARFSIRGEGNSCQIAEILFPMTPYSVATIPMTIQGDFGPISYDIDGDGTEDFQWSLIHPLLPSKVSELDEVLTDLQAVR